VIDRYRSASEGTPRPVAFGVVGAAAGLSDLELAQAYLYEDSTMVTTAAVRLLAVDAATTARWLVEIEPLLEQLARETASADSDVRRLRGGFAPALELRSLTHAVREGRLFAS
jgi:urease accessory protein